MRSTPTKRSSTPKPVTELEPLAVRPAQAARLLSIGERTLWTWIGNGRLRVSRVGGITLVHMTSIRALLGGADDA